MRHRFYLLLLLYIALFGCSTEIEIDQPPYTPKIVVDGFIEQDKPAMVFLTLSSPFLTHYDSASIVKTFLNYAKVEVTSSTGETEVLTLFKYDKFFPPFVYRTTEIKGAIGVEYQLKVSVKGRVVEAVTTIPNPPAVTQMRYNAQSDTMGFLEFSSQLLPSHQQTLFVQIRSKKADQNFHPCLNPVSTLPIGSSDYWVRAWRSKEMAGYSLDNSKNYYSSNHPRYLFHKSDTVWAKIGSIDSTAFSVLKSMFIDLNQNENPFAFNGNSVITNIEGGIGRWTGIGTAPIQWICGETQPIVDIK